MKKILLLVNNFGKKKMLFKDLIAKRLSVKGVDIQIADYKDLVIDLNDKSIDFLINGEKITNFSLVYLRKVGDKYPSLASTASLAMKSLGVKSIDDTWQDIGPLGDKFTSLVRLFLAGSPIPRTIFISNPDLKKYFDYLKVQLGLPFVSKHLYIQRGEGISLIKDIKDLDQLKANENCSNGLNQYMFQEYIEKDCEYRLLVLGEKVGVWEQKIAQTENEFRNNVALGAKEVFMPIAELPDEYNRLSVEAAKALNIQVGGVDLMFEKKTNKPYILEVNRGPGLTYDENQSPEIKQIADYLANLASENEQ